MKSNQRHLRFSIFFSMVMCLALDAVLIVCIMPSNVGAQAPQHAGPKEGYLILVGGGRTVSEVDERFVKIAGGKQARIVVIPTTLPDTRLTADGIAHLKSRMEELLGVPNITILHTRDRKVSDSEDFVHPLQEATGIWILGGAEEQLVLSYVGTRTEQEIHRLVARGGVLGGTSAGAMIQASYMPTSNEFYTEPILKIIREQGTGGGFGLLTNSTVAPHFAQRQYERALKATIAAHPDLLGIGIDEATALIVHGSQIEVIGEGRVSLYDGRDHHGQDHLTLSPGGKSDLSKLNAPSK